MADGVNDINMDPNAQRMSKVSAKEFASKFKSKREVYNFLTLDVKAFLPPYENVTIYFLKDLLSGTKKCKKPTF